MAISDVIKFGGAPDDLVWKYSGEEFNATSQLIVDETHQAVLVVNGQAADLFGPGRHTLSVPNIPLVKKIISIPTGGVSPFPCKVFYVTQVHQMDLLWGTQGAITLDDPLYDIFLHVALHGSMTFSVADTRKFLIKLVGFRNVYKAADLVKNFRGLISSHVKDCISKIMINGQLSYFMINAHLFEISGVVKERLDAIFEEYGIRIEYFNIETIDVPEKDYAAVTAAKERRTGRLIEGYTWQEKRQMMIAEKFAGNEGTLGNIGGAVGGFMMGGAFGGSITEIAQQALSSDRIPTSAPPKNVAGAPNSMRSQQGFSAGAGGFNVEGFFGNSASSVPASNFTPVSNPAPEPASAPVAQPAAARFCTDCGAPLVEGAMFCAQCGKRQETAPVCAGCGRQLDAGQRFCPFCGTKVS